MSNQKTEGALSTRGGTLILKSISLFLASGRNARNANNQNAKPSKSKTKRMGDKDSKNKISNKLLEASKKSTHFNRVEIEALYKIYRNLVSNNRAKPAMDRSNASGAWIMRKPSSIVEGINKTVFCELLHNTFDIVTEDMLMDRIFCVWDKENAGLLTPIAWFEGLSVFLRGTFLDKINFCFNVYDLNADGFITKDEIFQLLRNCLIKYPQDEDPDEGVKDLVEIISKKIDIDMDGKISLEDFQQSVMKEPLLLEAFGICLPSDRAIHTFLTTLKL